MRTASGHWLPRHIGMTIIFYRLSALYVVVGVVLATVHIPFRVMGTPPAFVQPADEGDTVSRMAILSRLRFDIGKPPSSIFYLFLIATAGHFVILGVFWDVRRRTKELALIRLFGGCPSLVVGFQVFCLSVVGSLVGGGFALLIGSSRSPADATLLILATVAWGLFFAGCLSIGVIAYADFCDVAAILQLEG